MATVKAEEITILPPDVEDKVEKDISSALVEVNVTDSIISQLKEHYGDLTINGQDDKQGYLTLQEARKKVKAIRVEAEKRFKKGRGEANAIVKKWIAKENEVIGKLEEIEHPLLKKEKAWEAERDRLKAERQAKIEQQGIKRMEELIKFGASLNGLYWTLGDVQYEAALVKEADEDIYSSMREEYRAVYEVMEAARIAKEEKEEADRLELKRQQDELAKQQEEMRQQQEEMKKHIKEIRVKNRTSFLEGLGMKSNDRGIYTYADQHVWPVDIQENDDQEWNLLVAKVSEGIAAAKKVAEEAQHAKEIFADRLPRLKEWSSSGLYVYANGTTWGEISELVNMSHEDFEILVKTNDSYIIQREKEKEQQRLKELQDAKIEGIGKSRRNDLDSIEGVYSGTDMELGDLSNETWASLYSESKDAFEKEQKKKNDEKEQERKDGLGDKAAWEEFVAQLKAINVPTFRSGQYRALGKLARERKESIESLQIGK